MDTATEVTGTQLITLDPEKYVTAVFASFRDRLDEAKLQAAPVAVDVTTSAGMKIAVGHRAIFRAIRVEAEKARVLRKAPILTIGKLLDTRYREIEAEIKVDEDRFDIAIKAEETRKETERAAREQAERERIEHIQFAIAELRAIPLRAVGKPVIVIAALMGDLEVQWDSDQSGYAEFSGEAGIAKVEARVKLVELLTAAQEHESALEQARKDRIELAARRLEEDKRQKEAAEREAETIRKQAAEEKAARDKIAAEERAANERIAAQAKAAQAEIDKAAKEVRDRQAAQDAAAKVIRDAEDKRLQVERDRLAAEARALEDRKRKEREEIEARDRAAREAQERVEREAREKAEEEDRAAKAKAQQEDEWTRDAEREAKRKADELLDGDASLVSFTNRFGHIPKYAKVCKAIDACLQPKKDRIAA